MKTSTSHPGLSVWRIMALCLVSAAIITGCSSGQNAGVGTGGTGTLIALDITDAPAIDYTHVYVTVTAVAFHTDTSAAFSSYSTSKTAGWEVVKLAAPTTVDLAQLTNGTMYADLNGNSSLFSGMKLPAGRYQQLRIFLASTEDAYLGSKPGLTYNNELQLNNDSAHYPLRIPSAEGGIKVLPESPLVVAASGNIRLALDFNLNDDIVKVSPNGATEFIFKPRLGYFDLGRVGAVKGTINFANLSSSRIEVKAEQLKTGNVYRVVRRITAVDKNTGTFNLYPLPVFGNATTATYDILIRGRNIQTSIVKGVKIHSGTNQTNGIDLGTISMNPGTEFTAQVGAAIHPTGSWLNFYQKIAGDSVPYEVSSRHLDPYTGKFALPVNLSTDTIRVATHAAGSPLLFATDNTSSGMFSVVADAPEFFAKGMELTGITAAAGQNYSIAMAGANLPQISTPATTGSIRCVFDMALLGTGTGSGMGMGRHIGYPPKGQIFVTHGGMIIDSLGNLGGDSSVNSALSAGGGMAYPVNLLNIPGNIPNAVYGIYALGWGNGYLAAGKALDIDLKSGGSVAVTIKMK